MTTTLEGWLNPKLKSNLGTQADKLPGEMSPRASNIPELADYLSCKVMDPEREVTPQDLGRSSPQGVGHVKHLARLAKFLLSDNESIRADYQGFIDLPRDLQLAICALRISTMDAFLLWREHQNVRSVLNLNPKTAKAFLNEYSPSLKESTRKQRAATMRSLLKELGKYHPAAKNKADLWLTPHELPRLENHESRITLGRGFAEGQVKELAAESSYIRVASGWFSPNGYDSLVSEANECVIRLLIGSSDHHGRSALHDPLQGFVNLVQTGTNDSTKRMALLKLRQELLAGSTRVRAASARQLRGLHAKVYIFDKTAAVLGSFNLSTSGLRLNVENSQVVTELKDVTQLIETYDELYEHADEIEAPILEFLEDSWITQEPTDLDPGVVYLRILLELYGSDVDHSKRTGYTMSDYQRYTVNQTCNDLVNSRGAMLIAPTGTGKSIMGMFVALQMQELGLVNRISLICPPHLVRQWERYIDEFRLPGKTKPLSFFRKQKGSDQDRADFAENLWHSDLVIIDESHQLKNDDSNGFQSMTQALGEPTSNRPYRLLMTATPMSKDIGDLNTQLSLIRRNCTVTRPSEVSALSGVAYLTHNLISKRFAIPDKDGKRYVEMSGEKRFFPDKNSFTVHYDAELDDAFEILEEMDFITARAARKDPGQRTLTDTAPEFVADRNLAIVRITAARMLESSPAAILEHIDNQLNCEVGKYLNEDEMRDGYSRIREIILQRKHDPKLRELLNRLKLLIRNNEKVLIFTAYKATVEYLKEQIQNEYPQLKIGVITGDTSDDEKDKIIRGFSPNSHGIKRVSRKEKIEVLIATDSIAEGVNLQDARFLVNYDLEWTPLPLIQRQGRLDRPTETHRTFHVWNFFPGISPFERIANMNRKLNARSTQYKQMAGLEVVGNHKRSFQELASEDLSNQDEETMRKMYLEARDISELIDEFMPSTDHLLFLASASDSQRDAASQLPYNTIVRVTGSLRSGVALLTKSNSGEVALTWYDSEGTSRSTLDGMTSLEAILARCKCDFGSDSGSIRPEIDDLLNQDALKFVADLSGTSEVDITPLMTIIFND